MIGLSVQHPVFRNMFLVLAILGFTIPASAQGGALARISFSGNPSGALKVLPAEEASNLFKKGEGVTDIDGNFYPSVIIGDQEWMAENLRVTRDADGNNIPRFSYQGNTENAELYGGLYSWTTAMNKGNSSNSGRVQGICPDGWHLPSDEEWSKLTDYLINNDDSTTENNVGNKLKSCRQVNSPEGGDCNTKEHPRWDAHTTHFGTNKFGFSALPGGYRHPLGLYTHRGCYGYWWSSSEFTQAGGVARYIGHYDGKVYGYHSGKQDSFSVRCVRD